MTKEAVRLISPKAEPLKVVNPKVVLLYMGIHVNADAENKAGHAL